MLKILDERVLKTDEEIEELYKDCKYLYIIDSYDKVIADEGYLYCVKKCDARWNVWEVCKMYLPPENTDSGGGYILHTPLYI